MLSALRSAAKIGHSSLALLSRLLLATFILLIGPCAAPHRTRQQPDTHPHLHATRASAMQSSSSWSRSVRPPLKQAHHISVPRRIFYRGFEFSYHHHGILFEYEDGKREVAHYNGDLSNIRNGVVQTTGLGGFLKGAPESRIIYHPEDDETIIKEGLKRFESQEIWECAQRRMGERKYDLVSNNCEHFVHDCLYGKPFSRQMGGAMSIVGTLLQGYLTRRSNAS